MGSSGEAEVLGAGPAGALVAAILARAGLPVRVRGTAGSPGPAGPSAGLLWGREGPGDLPAPLDRSIVEQRYAVLEGAASVSFDYRDPTWTVHSVDSQRYATALLDEARKAGAFVDPPSDAGPEPRSPENGDPSTGLSSGPRGARLTIVTELSGEASGPRVRPPTAREEWRAEGIYPLGATSIERRFGVGPGEGVSVEGVVSSPPEGPRVLGSMVTLRDAVVLGVSVHGAVGPDAARRALGQLAAHPAIAPFLGGSTPASIATGLRAPLALGPAVPSDGLLQCGPALGLDDPSGSLAPGLNCALRSAVAAATVAMSALRAGDVRARALAPYVRELDRLGVRAAMARGRRVREAMRDHPRFASVYPRLLTDAFHDLMTETGARKESISSTVRRARRRAGVSWFELGWDALEAGRVL